MVASLLVARGVVVSALPLISVRRLSAILCPRARSGAACCAFGNGLDLGNLEASLFPPKLCKMGGTSVRESRKKVQANKAVNLWEDKASRR